MNEALCLLLGAVIGFWLGLRLGCRAEYAVQAPVTVETISAVEDDPLLPASNDSFAVAGTPRKPTWRERRRELEAKQRTKREKIEQWRN